MRLGLFIYFFNAFFVFISDFVKIIGKYNHWIFSYSFLLLYICSLIFLFFALLIFFSFGFSFYEIILFFFYPIFIIVVLCFIPFPFSMFIYFWNWIFSFIGNIRSILLLIWAELIFDFCFLFVLLCLYYLNLFTFPSMLFFIFLWTLFFVFLCDSSRVPFDLLEGESELVSGFNTEFAFLNFLTVFFGEYVIFFLLIVLFSTFTHISLSICILLFLISRALLVRCFYIYILYLFWFYCLYILWFLFLFIMIFIL